MHIGKHLALTIFVEELTVVNLMCVFIPFRINSELLVVRGPERNSVEIMKLFRQTEG